MKKKRRVIILLAVIFAILIAAGSLIYMNRDTIKIKSLQSEYKTKRNNYVRLLEKNREDFEYVADTMKQWSSGTIFFGDDGINYTVICVDDYFSSNNEEIIKELSNNQEFYEHMMGMYQLNIFDSISIYQDSIDFNFSDPPERFHGSLSYYRGSTKDHSYIYIIDEHWAVDLIANI